MKSFIHITLWSATVGTFLILAAAGCGRDSVRVYHVDTNDTVTPTPPPMAAPGAMPTAMPAGLPVPDNSGQPSLQYTLPAGWEKKALTQMRVESFSATQDGKQADISVIPLAGTAGNDPANVNRWRGQVGLAALPEAELLKLAEKVTVGDLPADLYDLTGTAPGSGDAERIIGVILHRDDTAWFFKMTGDSEVVEKQKTAFIAFLKSISFGAPAAASGPMDMSQLPPSHPPIGGMDSALPAATVPAGDKPTWTVPAGWQGAPLAQFLIAKYVITGANGASAAVNVSSLAGDGGGLPANVNRWRGQIGLPAIAEILTTSFDVPGGKATVVDYTGTDARTGKPARLIGVLVPAGNQTWFYKLMGDDTVVTREKDAFIKFIQSAKYPDAR